MEEPVVLCKGAACQTSLKKLFKLKQDLQSLEKDVIEKVAGRFKQMEVDTEDPSRCIQVFIASSTRSYPRRHF